MGRGGEGAGIQGLDLLALEQAIPVVVLISHLCPGSAPLAATRFQALSLDFHPGSHRGPMSQEGSGKKHHTGQEQAPSFPVSLLENSDAVPSRACVRPYSGRLWAACPPGEWPLTWANLPHLAPEVPVLCLGLPHCCWLHFDPSRSWSRVKLS